MSNLKELQSKVVMEHPWHPAVIPFYLTNKSEANFYKALDILNFSLPETHPLFVTLHLEYSSILENDLMKKSALLQAVRSFGEFHFKTIELYSKFYHEGDDEYYLKAKRVRNI